MLEPLSSDYALEIGKMSKDSNFRVVEMVKMGVSWHYEVPQNWFHVKFEWTKKWIFHNVGIVHTVPLI